MILNSFFRTKATKYLDPAYFLFFLLFFIYGVHLFGQESPLDTLYLDQSNEIICSPLPIFLLATDVPHEVIEWSGGQASEQGLMISTPGMYEVIYQIDGVTTSLQIIVLEQNFSYQTSFIPASCIEDNGVAIVAVDLPNSSYTFEWDDGTILPVLANQSAGVYSFTISTDDCEIQGEVNIPEATPALPDIGEDTILCQYNNLLLTISPDAYTNYYWSTGSNSNEIEIQTSGTYGITVENEVGCQASNSILVSYLPVPTDLAWMDSSFCTGSELTLGQNELNTNYEWNTGSNQPIITIDLPGDYWLRRENQFGCFSIDSISLSEIALPVITVDREQEVCQGDTVIVEASTDGTIFQWSNGQTSLSFPTVVNENLEYSLLVTDETGCQATDTIQLVVIRPPSATIQGAADLVCINETVELTGSTTGLYSYWIDTTATLDVYSADMLSARISVVEPCEIRLVAGNECFEDTTSFYIDTYPQSSLSSLQPLTVYRNFPTPIELEGWYDYEWSTTVNLSCTDCSTPAITADQSTMLTVVVEDEYGCLRQFEELITVTENPNDIILASNFISANNDGLNDNFVIKGLEQFPGNRLVIFGPSGSTVASFTDYQNNWRATDQGRNLPPGTYYYSLQLGQNIRPILGTINVVQN